jgi:charged multivesicular body protein 3
MIFSITSPSASALHLEIKREETKVTSEIKKLAKEGTTSRTALNTLAKSLLKSRAARERMLLTTVQINSVVLTLDGMAAQLRVAQTLGKSAQLMKQMRGVMKLPEMQAVCRSMSREMYQAGLIEEAVDEAMSMADSDDIEEQAEATVDAVLFDVLQDVMIAPGPLKERIDQVAAEKATQQREEQEAVEEDKAVAELSAL